MSLTLKAFHQSLPLENVFRISRGAKLSAEVIVVTLSDGQHTGWGEAVPYSRYKESIDSVSQQLWRLEREINQISDHQRLPTLLPAGSARNALDCAFWDLKAKQLNQTVSDLVGLPECSRCVTAQTISINSTQVMQRDARKLQAAPVIKIKLDNQDVVEKIQAIHSVCPHSSFIVDANEAWDMALLSKVDKPLSSLNVKLIEQPLPQEHDDLLSDYQPHVALCADESCHTSKELQHLLGKYQAINIKLDKTGGLTEAVALLQRARELNFKIMIGCMVGSSLAMAPAFLLTGLADFVDLDGPLLVALDREHKFDFDNGVMSAAADALWGKGFRGAHPELNQLGS